jgi:hypothetical protein
MTRRQLARIAGRTDEAVQIIAPGLGVSLVNLTILVQPPWFESRLPCMFRDRSYSSMLTMASDSTKQT